ncbi:MAG TPA: hypothetical protein VJ771_06580 [Candidatus Nitrosotalea sp.]|nr:hypothetical protein [Candidatus Nitrosotalea sp.]
MYSNSRRYNAGQIGTVLKILAGVGLGIITIALMLFFNQVLSEASLSVYLQLVVDGCVIFIMSLLSLRIFERL